MGNLDQFGIKILYIAMLVYQNIVECVDQG